MSASTSVGSIHYDLDLKTQNFENAMGKVNGQIRQIGSSISSFGRDMTLFVTLPILGAGAAAFKAAADYEQLRVAFETMLGSGERANKILKELDELAVKTPFQITDVQNAARQLLAYGVAAEEVVPTTSMLGDLAAGSKERFDQLALAFGQVKAKTRLAGQEMLQFTNAGVGLREELSKRLGVSISEVDKKMEEGKITFEDVKAVLVSLTSEGGRFYKMNEKQALTTAGQISNLKDNFSRLARDLGEFLLPVAVKVVDKIREWMEAFKNLSPEQQKMIINIALMVAAIGPLLIVVGKLVTGFSSFVTLLSNPVSLAIGAIIILIAALVAGLIYIETKWHLFSDAIKKWWEFAKPYLIPAINELKRVIQEELLPALQRFWAEHGPMITKFLKEFAALAGTSLLIALLGLINGLVYLIQALSWLINVTNSSLNVLKSLWGIMQNGIAIAHMLGSAIINAANAPIRALQQLIDYVNRAANALKNLNPAQRHSPSLIDNIQHGTKQMLKDYGRFFNEIQTMATDVRPFLTGATMGSQDNRVSTQIYGNINIGNQADSNDFLRRLTRNQEAAARGGAVPSLGY